MVFRKVLIGKGYVNELDLSNGDTLGNPDTHLLSKLVEIGKKILEPLPKDHTSGDHGIFSSQEMENVIPLNLVKEMLTSIKKEVGNWLSKVDKGMGLCGPGPKGRRVKPVTILERPDKRKKMDLGLRNLDGGVGLTDHVNYGLSLSPSVWPEEVLKQQLLNCGMATQCLVEDGEVAARRTKVVYQRRPIHSEWVQWKVKENGKVLGARSGIQIPQDGQAVDVGVAMTGKRGEFDDGGGLEVSQ